MSDNVNIWRSRGTPRFAETVTIHLFMAFTLSPPQTYHTAAGDTGNNFFWAKFDGLGEGQYSWPERHNASYMQWRKSYYFIQSSNFLCSVFLIKNHIIRQNIKGTTPCIRSSKII